LIRWCAGGISTERIGVRRRSRWRPIRRRAQHTGLWRSALRRAQRKSARSAGCSTRDVGRGTRLRSDRIRWSSSGRRTRWRESALRRSTRDAGQWSTGRWQPVRPQPPWLRRLRARCGRFAAACASASRWHHEPRCVRWSARCACRRTRRRCSAVWRSTLDADRRRTAEQSTVRWSTRIAGYGRWYVRRSAGDARWRK
jgi:hypothetical protein